MSGPTGFFPDQAALDAASVDNSTPVPPSDASATDQSTTPITTALPAAQVNNSQPSVYMTAADTVKFVVYNSNPNMASITLTLRVVTPDGQILTEALTIANLTADRTANIATMGQLEGFLVSAVVSGVTAPTARGQCYATAGLIRGAAATQLSSFLLFADYVTTALQPQWPTDRAKSAVEGQGFITTYTAPNVGFGAEITIQQPPNTRWRVMSILATLSTGATVQNRIPQVWIQPTGGVVFAVVSPQTQTANQIVKYIVAPGNILAPVPALAVPMPLPIDLYVSNQSFIETNQSNLAVTDKWTTMVLQVEEWIDV